VPHCLLSLSILEYLHASILLLGGSLLVSSVCAKSLSVHSSVGRGSIVPGALDRDRWLSVWLCRLAFHTNTGCSNGVHCEVRHNGMYVVEVRYAQSQGWWYRDWTRSCRLEADEQDITRSCIPSSSSSRRASRTRRTRGGRSHATADSPTLKARQQTSAIYLPGPWDVSVRQDRRVNGPLLRPAYCVLKMREGLKIAVAVRTPAPCK
jgi:hypothetical protein